MPNNAASEQSRDRHIWGVLLIAMVGHAVAALLYTFLPVADTVRGAIYFGSKIVVNAIPLVWFLAIEKGRIRVEKPSARAVWVGLAWGVLIAVVLLTAYFGGLAGSLDADGLVEKVSAYGGVEHFLLLAVFICVFNSGLEEYYWRWFVFGRMRRLMDWRAAMVVSSIGFTLHHIVILWAYFPTVGLGILFNGGVFVGGCIWAWLFHRKGTIFAPWVSHALTDAAIMVAGYDLIFGF